ncbi:MAG: KpsF/GutQ family sugar-phosphate isomerase [Alphaproteobacteria bacterium]|nr:KpsF/GutQ family sugar-phosphate isomerase [Alphaproteobacteria bacterium]
MHQGVATVDSGHRASSARGPAESARDTIATEIKALEDVVRALETGELADAFATAARQMAEATGRVIVTGMGKSGHVGRKIAATLASTGTPAHFIHPAEASHGDLGMITDRDVVLALSWSGETSELRDIITYCRRFNVPLIGITSRKESTLGSESTICLALPPVQEACPNRLAPTSSTTAQIALGDALAVALIELRGFSADDFRIYHPGGKLGAQLLTVRNLMAHGDDVPRVTREATLLDATLEMTRKRYGIAAVVDENGSLVGAFTDGDLRRSLSAGRLDASVSEHISLNPLRVSPGTLASEALMIMNEHRILLLFVCEGDRLAGIIHVHDILRAGVA